jgi:uracil-DNA glycosylase
MRNKCPNCGDLLVSGYGQNSGILLLGDYPDYKDIRSGKCLTDDDIRRALTYELAQVGIQLSQCRYTNIWQHGKKEVKKGEVICPVEWHINQAVKEFDRAKGILVMGTDASKALFGLGCMELSGLKMKHKLYPKIIFYVSPNPASLSSDLGEFRLAIRRFAKEMNK